MKKKKLDAPVNPDQITKTMFDIIEIGLGIVPFDSLKGDTKAALASMSDEDARKAKRKFRKLWRKVIKSQMLAELVRRKSSHVSFDSERNILDDIFQPALGSDYRQRREARAKNDSLKPIAAAIPILAETTFGKVKKREVGLGISKKEQTDHQRRRRKKVVYQMIWDDYVTPMLENLKTSINKPSDERSSKAAP